MVVLVICFVSKRRKDSRDKDPLYLKQPHTLETAFSRGIETVFCLTEREKEVLLLIVKGHTNREIAKVLGISVNTAKRHITNIFDKLGVNDRVQAAVSAILLKLV
ncbi:MAG: response regulator transcription factor [Deltaproteobacteria bacterium]|nr:response regulator transcription factor [Deltaproteobacteria bacterium]